jgi:glycosyltransferase involved in cell wall biosynthesis
VPLVHQEDGFGPEEAHRYLRRRIWLRRCLLGNAAAVAVPSRVLAELAVRAWRQPAEKVHYLPNGVDLGRFRAADPVGGEKDPGPRPLVVGTVGHLRPEKHQALLLRAFARCVSGTSGGVGPSGTSAGGPRLLVVGDGPMGEGLRSLARELGIADRVEFAGNVDDTAPVYRRMDLFALSSDTEQMPLTVLEAMACGLPVVATDVGDIAHMLHPDNRPFLAPRGEVALFAARLASLLQADPSERAALGAANRRHCAAHFDRQSCYRAWVDLYEDVFGLRERCGHGPTGSLPKNEP